MPGSNAGHLTQALMSFSGQLLGVPAILGYPTLETMTLGDTNDINHLILAEDRRHRHLLLQPLPRPVHFLCHRTTIQLHFHHMGLLLSEAQHVDDDADDGALLFACLILPLLTVLREGLLFTSLPVFVESPFTFITHTLDGPDVSNNPHHYHRGCLNDGHRLHLFSGLTHARAMDLPQGVCHASLIPKESSKMDRFTGVIFRPTAHFPPVLTAAPAWQESHVPMTRGMELTMRLLKVHKDQTFPRKNT
uniref:Uncharacterized protein n=1 Tax=Denticeps clupeoides TaxID=299321 RepID=A0AAY4BCN5_9TELE